MAARAFGARGPVSVRSLARRCAGSAAPATVRAAANATRREVRAFVARM